MTEIRFYHLQTQSLEQALPQILGKAYAGGRRIVVRTNDAAAAQRLNDHLWTYRADSFLPHGSAKEGYAEDQPVWLTDRDENPNKADVLILTGGTASEKLSDFTLCCELFDGRDELAVTAARSKWKTYKDAGFDLTYWQQNEAGGWDKK
ncbi:MAG: DNA polymerase III subunit chi [Rhodospirillales bacterium]|nr:DNA polymerase III subunit chi [Rhodospirillales bacterium]MCB9996135.1 DNA polymerase III subunit chi [Rhodospirillales bacterium]